MQSSWVNNTCAAAETQILADGYRPGNVNTVKEVFDFSLRGARNGISLGSNSGQAGAWLSSGQDLRDN